MKLLIRNLPRTSTEAEIRLLFETYGRVQSCSLVMDKQTGLSKGFAFIEMPRPGDAKAAVKTLNATNLNGKIIRVKKAAAKKTATEKSATSEKETMKTTGENSPAKKAEPPKTKVEQPKDEEAEKSKSNRTVNRDIWSSNE